MSRINADQEKPEDVLIMQIQKILNIFYIDELSMIMVALVIFINLIIWIYSYQYMQGDEHYKSFLAKLLALCLSVIGTLIADRFEAFVILWAISNFLLIKLMIHKPQWKQARASGWLAAFFLSLSTLCIGIAFSLFYWITDATSIHEILEFTFKYPHEYTYVDALIFEASLALICLGALAQSAIWPFHRWLLSSLNSPTPVSAIMHAGLINGGGFLLVRFAPFYSIRPGFLSAIFILGLLTAILGTFWKLLQSDIKRMLACSTMAQMGFMMVQCGLGLFSAAITHLCWHGLFKAYLFLSSNSVIKENRIRSLGFVNARSFALSVLCGLVGSYFFGLTSGKIRFSLDSSLFLLGITFMAALQFSLVILIKKPFRNFLQAFIITSVAAGLYGMSIGAIKWFLAPLNLETPQPLNLLYYAGFASLFFIWFMVNFGKYWQDSDLVSKYTKRLYVWALNASQPQASTITNHHNYYAY